MTQVPPPVSAPLCYRHNSRETYVRCTRCDRPICPECMRAASVGHQCPECVAAGRRTQRPARTAFGGSAAGAHGYVTITLIVLNCVLLVLSVMSTRHPGNAIGGGGLGGLLGGQTPLMEKLGVYGGYGSIPTQFPDHHIIYGVSHGEYYRLFTAMFMHYGLLHLAVNMWALWVLGRPLEAMFGPVRFLTIYLVCGLGGNVAAYIFATHSLSAGASTALFGMFGVLFFVLRRLRRSVAQLVPVLVINLVITFSVPGISIAGHVGGLVTGALVGAGMTYAPQARRSQIQAAVIVGACVLLGAATLWQTGRINA